MMLDCLPLEDIASPRLASATSQALSKMLFRRFLEDILWLWEARDLPIGVTQCQKLNSEQNERRSKEVLRVRVQRSSDT